MVKKFLFSTILTTAVAVLPAAALADAPSKHQVKTSHKKEVAKKKHHDDAYKASKNHQAKPTEEMVIFANAGKKEAVMHDSQKQDALVNSDGFSVKVGGKVDIQYGVVDQEKDFEHPSKNENLPQSEFKSNNDVASQGSEFMNKSAMVSNGELKFTAEKADSDNKYGLELGVNANTSPSSSGNKNVAKKVYLYMENPMGRFEAGANDGASEAMSVSATSIAKGTGGIDGDWDNWVSYGAIGTVSNKSKVLDYTFLTTPTLPYASQHSKKANKLTYYTPTFNGFKAGFSYVPDVTVQGTTYQALSFKGSGYKNVFEAGVSYEHNINSDTSFELTATGQVGEARDAYKDGYNQDGSSSVNFNTQSLDNLQDESKPTAIGAAVKESLESASITQSGGTSIEAKTIPLKRLGAWQVGGKVSHDGFTVAASYGDWGKSGTLKNVEAETPKKVARFWTAGVSYTNEVAGVSFTYMGSHRQGAFTMSDYVTNNQKAFDEARLKFNAFSLGAEYKITPGFMPYAEVTRFEYKAPDNLTNITANKGMVVLGGLKLNF